MTTIVHHLSIEDLLFAAARHYRHAQVDTFAAHATAPAGADLDGADLIRLRSSERQRSAAFDKGLAMVNVDRRDALEARTAAIRASLDVDIISGKPVRGRPGRIARKLGLKRRTVDRILATL